MNQSSKYPNLIIGGAPKCGTSSLFFWLGAHPEVCPSKTKETYFLADRINKHNRKFNIHEHGLEAYQKYFEHCGTEKYRTEATAIYIFDKTPREVFRKLPETPKVIFIFRRPGDRLYSHWRFNRYRMKNTKMSFEEYLDPKTAATRWRKNYLEDTKYIELLKPWMRDLGKEQLMVFQMEKLTGNPRDFMRDISRQLGIAPDFYKDFDFFHRNETVAVKNKKLHRLGLKLEPLVPTWVQEKLIPLYLKMNASKAPEKTKREKELIEEVNRKYEPHSRELAEHFPTVDYNLWHD